MPTLEAALALAVEAHRGQRDKAGQPYILHPLRVMLAIEGALGRIAAVLHDVVEDTDVTLEDLARERFDRSVIEALRALTKLPEEDRLAAAERAVANSIARNVKLADNANNSDLSRIANPT